jgi:hypothetical protein
LQSHPITYGGAAPEQSKDTQRYVLEIQELSGGSLTDKSIKRFRSLVSKLESHPVLYTNKVASFGKRVMAALTQEGGAVAGIKPDPVYTEQWIADHNEKMQFLGSDEAWRMIQEWFLTTEPNKAIIADFIMIGEHGFHFITRGRTKSSGEGDGQGWKDDLFAKFPQATQAMLDAEAAAAQSGDRNAGLSQSRRKELRDMGMPLAAQVNLNAVGRIALLALQLGPSEDQFIDMYIKRHGDRPLAMDRGRLIKSAVPAKLRDSVSQARVEEHVKIFNNKLEQFAADAAYWQDVKKDLEGEIAKAYTRS